jgi:archaellum component FlaC
MPFSVSDFDEFLRLLDEHPEWREQLRRRLLAEEFLRLPAQTQEVLESQRRLEAAVAALAEAQQRFEERLSLVEARLDRVEERLSRVEEWIAKAEERLSRVEEWIAKAEERLSRVEEWIAKAEERLSRLEAAVAALAEAQQRFEERLSRVETRLDRVEERLSRVETRVGDLVGDNLERRYRERAGAYFGRILRRPTPVDLNDLRELLEPRLPAPAVDDVLLADLILRGRLATDGTEETYLLLEVSAIVDERDVDRAVRRASLLRRAGLPTLAIVAGEDATAGAREAVTEQRVALLLDGSTQNWEAALAARREE